MKITNLIFNIAGLIISYILIYFFGTIGILIFLGMVLLWVLFIIGASRKPKEKKAANGSIRELIVFIRIIHTLDKESKLEYMLAKHQCKMTNIHEKYKIFPFRNPYAMQKFQELHNSVLKRWNGG